MIKTIIIIIALVLILILTSKGRMISLSSDGLFSRTYTNCLRGIAILMIMIGHISGTMDTVVFSPLASTGVALFLILSGYGVNESYKKNGLHNFWGKRIFRVLLPYSFVFVCLAIHNHDWSPIYWILNLFGLSTAYWYIAFIVRCYMIFWLSSLLLPKYRIWSMAFLSLVLFLVGNDLEAPQSLSFVVGVFISQSTLYPPPKTQLQGHSHVRLLYRISESKILLQSLIISAFLLGTGFLAFKQLSFIRTAFYGTHMYDFIQMMIVVPYSVAVMAFVYRFKRILTSRMLLFTGAISYELYLIHFPFYGFVNGNMAYVIVFFIGSYLGAWIYKRFISMIETGLQDALAKIMRQED